MKKATAEYIKKLLAEDEYQLKSERMAFDNDCKILGRITNPTYLKESNEELALINDAYKELNKILNKKNELDNIFPH